jgi:hypothetical protein
LPLALPIPIPDACLLGAGAAPPPDAPLLPPLSTCAPLLPPLSTCAPPAAAGSLHVSGQNSAVVMVEPSGLAWKASQQGFLPERSPGGRTSHRYTQPSSVPHTIWSPRADTEALTCVLLFFRPLYLHSCGARGRGGGGEGGRGGVSRQASGWCVCLGLIGRSVVDIEHEACLCDAQMHRVEGTYTDQAVQGLSLCAAGSRQQRMHSHPAPSPAPPACSRCTCVCGCRWM